MGCPEDRVLQPCLLALVTTAPSCLPNALKGWDPLCQWYDLSLPPLLLIICAVSCCLFVCFLFFVWSVPLKTEPANFMARGLLFLIERSHREMLAQDIKAEEELRVERASSSNVALALRWPSPSILIGHSRFPSPAPNKISYPFPGLQRAPSLESS